MFLDHKDPCYFTPSELPQGQLWKAAWGEMSA